MHNIYYELFLPNKYTRWYFDIIFNASDRILLKNTYIEKHHIIPRCMGGTNDKSNIVKLTAREHFICHMLLEKMTTGQNKFKLACAAKWMASKHRDKISARMYAIIKKIDADHKSTAYTKNIKPLLTVEQKQEKRRIASSNGGKAASKLGLGFKAGHASSAGKKGGIKGGQHAKENLTGIFNLSTEKKEMKNYNRVLTMLLKSKKIDPLPWVQRINEWPKF